MQTQTLPFAGGYNNRQVSKNPTIALKNRFYEENVVLQGENPVSAIARPGLRKFTEVGSGPIRSLFTAEGLFNDDLFVVSGNDLYRVDVYGASTFIGTISSDPVGGVSWAPIAAIGDTPARLFFAEGGVLWVYSANGQAQGLLQASGAIATADTISIDGVYYQWTSGSVDTGTPDGSSGNPWLVDLGADNAAAILNMVLAIDASGTEGVTYSTGLTEHPTVSAGAYTSSDMYVNADTPGIGGNSIALTETGANLAWDNATLTGGGDDQLRQVYTPDDIGAISVAHINSYVIVVPVQSEELETVGRFYWIEPGETSVDALNFATAERSSDKINQVVVFSNLFWLCGQKTTEPWLTTGNPAAPMRRFDSILFDRGSWEGTARPVKDSMIVVDEDGAVFQIKGGQERISTPAIEERIRRAIAIEKKKEY